MPLTASGQAGTDANRQGFVRVMAGVEALILAGVLYLCSSVRSQELSMAELKASTKAFQEAAAAVPALTVEVAKAKQDILANSNRINENTEDIKELRAGQVAVANRDAKWR